MKLGEILATSLPELPNSSQTFKNLEKHVFWRPGRTAAKVVLGRKLMLDVSFPAEMIKTMARLEELIEREKLAGVGDFTGAGAPRESVKKASF